MSDTEVDLTHMGLEAYQSWTALQEAHKVLLDAYEGGDAAAILKASEAAAHAAMAFHAYSK